jgi:DNA gyrase subunit A
MGDIIGGDSPSEGLRDLLIEEEMKESYLTYAMSVLVDRALPDIRDGLKPVHRRILFSMRDLNLNPGAKYQKSAKIVGQCIGNYHPHGDTAVYDAMVRMAQDFSLRYMLVDGQGNFGSIDGDAAAAYRYTEAKMAPAAGEMLEDIQYDTVDMKPNFDQQNDEPVVLPAKLPNLLINGSSGIAVGMATNIPPHNLGEVCQAAIHVIDNPACTVSDLMEFVRAPDFPTGGYICGTGGIRTAYETGRGRCIMRAKITTEELRGGQMALVVTEIPYGVKTTTIKESIVKAVNDENVKGLSEVRGGAVANGLRLELLMKRGEDPDVILNQLWKHTSLQSTFGLNMIALDGGRPRTVGLKRMLQAFIEHRKEVIVRRTRFLLARDEARLHIVLGLLKAIDIIDQIIALIRSSSTTDEARQGLIERWDFSERQANAILEMQLRRLTGLEREKLDNERQELEARIADYRDILAREERQFRIIKDDLQYLCDKFGDPRRTEITAAAGDLAMEDLIEDEECVVTITKSGYIKRLPSDTYRTQRRGGKGISGGKLKDDEDYVKTMFLATTHDWLLFFTNFGKVYWLKVYELPQMSRTSRGRALPNVISLEQGETLETCFAVREFPDDRYLFFATAKGQVKKTVLSAYGNVRQGGIKAIKLADEDRLISVLITGGDNEVILATRNGQAIRFNEGDCRPMGRDTAGVTGINLGDGDQVVAAILREPDTEVLSVCENGNGKRTGWDEYRKTKRGGKGVININTERNGPLVACLAVLADDEIICNTRGGMVVRTSAEHIRVTGRAASGVRVVNIADGDALIAVARCDREDDEEGGEAEGGDGTAPDAPTDSGPAPLADLPPTGVPGAEEMEDHGGPDDF